MPDVICLLWNACFILIKPFLDLTFVCGQDSACWTIANLVKDPTTKRLARELGAVACATQAKKSHTSSSDVVESANWVLAMLAVAGEETK